MAHPPRRPDSLRPGSAAVVCTGGAATRFETRPRPRPGRGEMVLRLRGCGLCGTDLFKLAHGAAAPGTVLGHEVVGSVEDLGEGTAGFDLGDRVVVPHHVPCGKCPLCERGSETLCAAFRENLLDPGGFSEHIRVKERAVKLAARRIPDGIADEAAVFMEPAACVRRGVSRAGLPPEEAKGCAVVLGAGSMGLLHLLVLKALQPGLRVLVSDTVPERLGLAERLGAAAAKPPGESGIAAAVRETTAGLGADAVFDTVGGAALLDAALDLTREGGTVVLFAHASGGERARFDLNRLFRHERRVVGTYSGTVGDQEEVFRMIAACRLDPRPLITHKLPLGRFQEAVELTRARRALKVLLVPEGEEDR